MRAPRPPSDRRGVLSLEFVLVVVGVLGALMLVAAAWRLGQTRGEMRDAAAQVSGACCGHGPACGGQGFLFGSHVLGTRPRLRQPPSHTPKRK